MSSPDPFGDALDQQAQGASNEDHFDAALSARANEANAPAQKTIDKYAELKKGSSHEFMGGLEAGISAVTGGAASMVGGLRYALDSHYSAEDYEKMKQALTYQPRTKEGQADVQGISNAIGQLGGKYEKPASEAVFNATGSPALAAGTAAATHIPENVATLFLPKLAGKVGEALKPAEAEPYANPQSMGAAATSAQTKLATASPDLQEAAKGIPPEQLDNNPVLNRHLEADSLPVKMRLTEGQATQDPDIISNEMNKRGATGLSKVLADQGQKLKDNLQAMRENAGPDVFTTDHVQHGQALIDAYKEKDAPVLADIDAKYQKLRDAAGGDIPIDGQTFVNNARSALKKQLLSNDVPASVAADLKDFGDGQPMSFEDFESMRTKLAREMRDNPSGNARTAAGIVRQSLEDLPLKNGAEHLKPLADEARSAAKARFDALKADPAYDAAVNDKVAPDQFVSKYVTGNSGTATAGQAARMRQNLADNPTALQTMGVATIDELRKAAGVDSMGNGKFGADRYNKRLESLSPKIQSLLPPETVEHARTLGNVSRYIKQAPEGNTVNSSGTLSGAIAQAAGKTAQSIANVHTGGLAGPVIDFAKGKISENALRRELETATAPLAGVSRPTSAKPNP